jgi:hypothetical protein
MPTTAVRTVLAASGTALPLQGTQYEFPDDNCVIELALSADATGVLVTIMSGSEVIMEEAPVQLGTINVQAKYPDDFYIRFPVLKGERVKVALRDTSAAQRIVLTNVILNEA